LLFLFQQEKGTALSTKCPRCQFENPDDAEHYLECSAPLRSEKEAPSSVTKTLHIPTKELAKGSSFARKYEILDEIGKGCMGRVYKALDKEVNEAVAIKVLKPERL